MDYNCPNCGAPVTGRVCEYCGTRHAKESEHIRIDVKAEYTEVCSWDGAVVRRVWNRPSTVVKAY